jgi:uncharacterized membrane protein YfcA
VNDPLQLVLLAGIGIISGFLNVLAGGGSTITLPMLIFMGMDGTLANGTNRVAILMQNISAVTSFHTKAYSRFRQSSLFALCAVPGAVAGALFAVQLSDQAFQKILGVVMLGVIISMILPPAQGHGRQPSRPRQLLIYPTMALIGFYGGFIQVGVGFIFMAALYHLLKLDLVFVNMHKVFIVLIYTIPALAVFAWNGQVAWLPGAILGVGNAAGAWWAAHVSIKKGDKVIRYVLVVAVLLMALKLFGLF